MINYRIGECKTTDVYCPSTVYGTYYKVYSERYDEKIGLIHDFIQEFDTRLQAERFVNERYKADAGKRKIVMTCDDLARLLTAVKEYKYWYLYDGQQNTDGEGVWHADVWLSNNIKLGESDWGEGEDNFSFDEVSNE